MKILLVYPQYPDTFWSFKQALKFISKKALLPPLGLPTVAAMLPKDFERRLIDMNITKLTDKDILWADYVFISAMITQKESAINVIERCRKLGVKTVAGGPLFTSLHEEFPDVNHLVLDEGEVTVPLFLEDLNKGTLKKIYRSSIKPNLSISPIPQWELLDLKSYSKMPIQYSRGCPFDCEFCDIVNLNGRIPRTKKPLQVIKEINALIRLGWDAGIFIVDDNFIGNKSRTKELLKALIKWRKLTGRLTTFMTEVSLNLADDEELMGLMRDAGFNAVFVGLETPSSDSLEECGKYQNKNRDLISSVKMIQSYGMEVTGGFIVGFDNDDDSIFARQIEFIQKTGVVVAMIGMLQALPGTKLYERLKQENRLLKDSSGNNTDFSVNFVPKIGYDALVNGYKSIIASVYSPQKYYERVQTFMKNYKAGGRERLSLTYVNALLKSMMVLGVLRNGRRYYWRIFFTSLFKYPNAFTKAVTMAVYYAHFKDIFQKQPT